MKFTTKLIKSEDIAHGTMAFYFAKPAGWQFKAGQYNKITLLNPSETDGEGNSRDFSISSAPCEEHLMIASRMRDTAFKRVLTNMKPGGEIEMDGPMGSFTLHNDTAKPAVYLMGGIGVTPARSMLVQAAHDKLPHKLFLFYSNHTADDAAWLAELKNLEQQNPNYKFIPTMTDLPPGDTSWTGETGYIDAAMLKRHLADIMKPIYYISGPPMMVTAIADRCAEPAPIPNAVGMSPATIENVVIKIGLSLTWFACMMASRSGTPCARSLLV